MAGTKKGAWFRVANVAGALKITPRPVSRDVVPLAGHLIDEAVHFKIDSCCDIFEMSEGYGAGHIRCLGQLVWVDHGDLPTQHFYPIRQCYVQYWVWTCLKKTGDWEVSGLRMDDLMWSLKL